MKRNWIQEQPVVSSMVIQKNLKGIDFIVPTITQELLTLKMISLLKMMKLVRVKQHIIWKFEKLGYKFFYLLHL